ncbi:MAG: ankyrin repeat domain-containing protein [Caulobacteraceae bacterium]
MDKAEILDRIAKGRTDLVFELLRLPDWRAAVVEGLTNALQWFVYYGDATALRAVIAAGGGLSSLDLNAELGNAAFAGHWKVCDLLLSAGADSRFAAVSTAETPLHNAVSRAGRPDYVYVVRLLLEHGADPNARTVPGRESCAFMRDVRTKGETPLHRAAAFCDPVIIQALIEGGGDLTLRDAQGDTPLSWASWHQRPGAVLHALKHGGHQIGARHVADLTSDHGAGWGSGMGWALLGDYLPDSKP